MTIYDGFSFFDELELLEIRFGELYHSVDYFIVVESNRTFRGTPKPLYFSENKHLFEKYLDKVISIQCNLDHLGVVEDESFNEKLLNTESPEYKTVWKREKATKDCIALGLSNSLRSSETNILLVSDVDEIPRPEVLHTIRYCDVPDPLVLVMPRYNFQFSWIIAHDQDRKTPLLWYGTIVVKQSKIDPRGLDKQRSDRAQFHALVNSGWHFSNFNFGVGRYETKLRNFAHQEHSHPNQIQQLMESIQNAPKTQNIIVLSPNEMWCSLPKYVHDHPSKFMNQTGLSATSPFLSQRVACINYLQEFSSSIPSWIFDQLIWE